MRGLQAHCPVWQRGVLPPLPSQRVGNRSLVFLAASSEEQMCRREHGNGVGQSVRSDTHTLLRVGRSPSVACAPALCASFSGAPGTPERVLRTAVW